METAEYVNLNELRIYLLSHFPGNLGILVYGSAIYEPLAEIDDIDVLILSPKPTRKRLVSSYSGKGLHISILSKDILIADLVESQYGEYYVNKVMNPYWMVMENAELDAIIRLARRTKALSAIALMYPLVPSFTVLEMIKLITLIRSFQFPHYFASAVTMFAHTSSISFLNLASEYRQTLYQLAKESILEQTASDEFAMRQGANPSDLRKVLEQFYMAIPRYWNTFAEIHEGHWSTVEGYLKKRAEKQQNALTRYQQGMTELLSNRFVLSSLLRMNQES